MAVQKNIVFKVDIEGTGKAEDSLKGLESRIDKLKELRQGEQIGSKAFNDLSRDIQKAEAAIVDLLQPKAQWHYLAQNQSKLKKRFLK
jgi:hypothetical protein